MGAFSTIPNLVITSDTVVIPDDSRAVGHAAGGTLRGRSAYSEKGYRINVIVKGDVAVKLALDDFYENNVNDMNTITIDDSDYSAMFLNRPRVTSKDGAIRWLEFGLLGFEV